jgi:hypothetical protein
VSGISARWEHRRRSHAVMAGVLAALVASAVLVAWLTSWLPVRYWERRGTTFPLGLPELTTSRHFQRAGEACFSTSGYGGAATIESSDACSFAVSNTQS